MERERERLLVHEAMNGNNAARDELICSIHAFVWKHAIKLSNRHNKSAEDLAQHGMVKVVQMFDRFDPSLGFRFLTYFGTVAIREMKRHAWHDGIIQLKQNYHLTQANYKAAEKVRDDTIVSLAALDNDADSLQGGDDDPADAASDREMVAKVRAAIQTLPRQQMRVMRLKSEGRTNPEIKAIIGVTRQRIQQLEKAASIRLRRQLEYTG